MRTFSISEIKQVLDKKGYIFFDGNKPFNLNIIGIRSNDRIANTFNDVIIIIYRDGNLNLKILQAPATTDPGTYWRNHPMNVQGTHIMVPGQYHNVYKTGLHKGEYKALVQVGKIKFYTDNNRDNILDMNPATIIEGIIGADIHHASNTGVSILVDKWSAACQVFANILDFNMFMQLVNASAARFGDVFSYTLLEENDFKG